MAKTKESKLNFPDLLNGAVLHQLSVAITNINSRVRAL